MNGESAWLSGGCHCGAVRFRVRAAERVLSDCNCSMCAKKGILHLIVGKADFELLSGEEQLSLYQFNTRVARHLFCRVCGVHAFYVPRSHPDGVDVNARCLDDVDLSTFTIRPFDGLNWEAARSSLP